MADKKALLRWEHDDPEDPDKQEDQRIASP